MKGRIVPLCQVLPAVLLLGACGATHMVKVNGTMQPTGSRAATFGAQFSFVCDQNPSISDFSSELDAITPVSTRIGGSALVYIPTRSKGVTACADIFREAQIEAIRRAKVFDTLQLIDGAPRGGRPSQKDADYVFWAQSGESQAVAGSTVVDESLVLAYKDGPRVVLPNGPARLDQWVKTIGPTILTAKTLAQSTSLEIGSRVIARRAYYSFMGKEYVTGSSLDQAIDQNNAKRLDAYHPDPAVKVGGKARVIISTYDAKIKQFHRSIEAVKNGLPIKDIEIEALEAAVYANDAESRLRAESLKKAQLFDSIVISVEDVMTPPAIRSEIVIWQPEDKPSQWMIRNAVGKTQEVEYSPSNNSSNITVGADLEQFVSNVYKTILTK